MRILRGLDIAVAAGGVTALIGGNGAGKTTIMRLIAGALPVQAGRLGLPVKTSPAWPAHRRVDAGLALVPEGRLVFPSMTVEENLRLGGIANRAPAARRGAGARRSMICSRGCGSGAIKRPAPCPAASNRCWPSAAA